MSLPEEQRVRYRDTGLVSPVPALSADEVRRYRAACDDLEAQLGGKPRTIEVRQMHLHFPWAFELATHPLILDAVEALLGPDLLVWATELFAKWPRDATVSVGWHRDEPYLGLSSGRSITAWVALGPSSPTNGCMRLLPRNAPQQPAPPPRGRPWEIDPRALVDVVLRPGEMSLHAADVLHGSAANTSGEKRVGLAIRYLTADARLRRDGGPVVLARGRAPADLTLASPPRAGDPAEALAGMRRSAGRHLEAVLANLRLASSQEDRQ